MHDISMKLIGPWEVRRRIKLPALVHAADAMAVERIVGELKGVLKVVADPDKHQVTVRYDANQAGYPTIIEAMKSIGFPPLDSWWCRIKGNWYQYSDDNTRDVAKVPPAACCNKPPK
ncbi:MAG: hypothetical protein B6D77_04940 [gamma proteobacterium symbiont of Ctena orbiculata]|nr:MAG: hypothetical protein B6D77_04940 [gamma proteobacterium symbiont of Ctena orbiculata]PVV20500.1 MAG: hypothetical protein B6D79_14520 [gamma proteobacterium symbiont of Ctena orbiculata]PVV25379.1 MAG: hypothetical protein B6D78_00385 [gamma proteobacterium symbiont of Ctena orbiculata]